MNYKDKIEEMMGDLLGLETQAFTTGAVTQQYVKWDDLFTLLFDTGEQITSLIEQAQRDAVMGFARWCDIDQEAIYNHPHFMQDYADQYLNQTKEDIKEKQ